MKPTTRHYLIRALVGLALLALLVVPPIIGTTTQTPWLYVSAVSLLALFVLGTGVVVLFLILLFFTGLGFYCCTGDAWFIRPYWKATCRVTRWITQRKP